MKDGFPKLDPLLHSELRLAVMSVLISVKQAEFNYLKEKTGATGGNLSVQINKLKQAGYIQVKKEFVKNYPKTTCSLTEKGRDAFKSYIKSMNAYLKGSGQ